MIELNDFSSSNQIHNLSSNKVQMMNSNSSKLYPKIAAFLDTLPNQTISQERKSHLDPLAKYLQSKVLQNEVICLHFICTHNSRRSHLAQIWAQTIAHYVNINMVFCYSGGTEETALFPTVAKTLQQTGFQIELLSEGNNPVYSIKYAENVHPIIGFSKKIDHSFNPSSAFAAIMTCDSANEACPIVHGAEQRFPITFEDPKKFDHTPHQIEKYAEHSEQIAAELHYVFSQINR